MRKEFESLQGTSTGWGKTYTDSLLYRQLVDNPDNYDAIQSYWDTYRMPPQSEHAQSPESLAIDRKADGDTKQADGYQRSRTMSSATVPLSSDHVLSPHHPAASLVPFLHTFGPLSFLLFRAALLRKRILFVTEAPVELACNYGRTKDLQRVTKLTGVVYDLSILASLPRSLLSCLPADASPELRLRPLYSVGIQDIPYLSENPQEADRETHHGWVACTTDDVLSSKPQCFDVLVVLPGLDSKNAAKKSYPKIVPSSSDLLKKFPKVGLRATQRDAHRYESLLAGLKSLHYSRRGNTDESASLASDQTAEADEAPELGRDIVEPASWSRMAYTSLVWWASSGDKRAGLGDSDVEEHEEDAALLRGDEDEEQTKEVTLVAYFHRLTTKIFTTIAEAVARADGHEERYQDEEEVVTNDGNEDPVHDSHRARGDGAEDEQSLLQHQRRKNDEVEIGQEAMAAMGLDIWSEADRTFVEELMTLYWKRKAVLRGGTIECCGIRFA